MDNFNSNQVKKKQKIQQALADNNFDYNKALQDWTQCCHLIKHKRRFCNMGRSPNSQFCGTHRPVEEGVGNRIEKKSKKQGIPVSRCPCPIDPSHTVYLHNLEMHVKVCNIRTRNNLLMQQPYYSENCNSGIIEQFCQETSTITPPQPTVCPEILAQKLIRAFQQIDDSMFKNPYAISSDYSATNNTASQSIAHDDNTDDSSISKVIEKLVLETVAPGQSSPENLRHAQQDFKIIHQMVKSGLINIDPQLLKSATTINDTIQTDDKANENNNTVNTAVMTAIDTHNRTNGNSDSSHTRIINSSVKEEADQAEVNDDDYDESQLAYVELGAGKGMLGLAVFAVQPRATIVLVERSGTRRKADKLMRSRQGRFCRARMDIRHCLLTKLPGVNPDTEDVDFNGLTSNKHSSLSMTTTPESTSSPAIDVGKEILNVTQSNDDNITTILPLSTAVAATNNNANAVVTTSSAREVDKHVTVIAKHLCGCATDMAIRSLGAAYGAASSTAANITNKHTLSSSRENKDDSICSKSNISSDSGGNNNDDEVLLLDSRARGLAIATCCHHACSWTDYVGKAWLLQQGITAAEFDVLKLWSGWAHTLKINSSSSDMNSNSSASSNASSSATSENKSSDSVVVPCDETNSNELPNETNTGIANDTDDTVGTNSITTDTIINSDSNNNTDNDHTDTITLPSVVGVIRPTGITRAQMSHYGWMTKRVLDHGRIMYLRNSYQLIDAKQIEYCEREMSPENIMLIATRRT